jgi:hypothetical protein
LHISRVFARRESAYYLANKLLGSYFIIVRSTDWLNDSEPFDIHIFLKKYIKNNTCFFAVEPLPSLSEENFRGFYRRSPGSFPGKPATKWMLKTRWP